VKVLLQNVLLILIVK